MIVQDRRFSPKSGRVVAYVGNYNPHSKAATIDKEKISSYLSNGAVPSDRVARLLQKEGVKLPAWYSAAPAKKKAVRNPGKRRSTRPPEAEAPQTAETTEQVPKPEPEEVESESEAEKPESTDSPAESEQPKPDELASEGDTEKADSEGAETATDSDKSGN